MKTFKLIFVLVVFLLAVKFTNCQERANEKRKVEEIDKLVGSYVTESEFMGSVLVADKGRVIFARGYGLADVDKNIPNTPQTQFGVGSISKQFTAMLVTQLAEKGKLRFDNTISDFVPEFPEDIGGRITVEMLLCHTSGLILPEGIEKYYYATTKQEYLLEYIRQLDEEGLRFEPGEGYGYSNAGYFLLGLIIEKASGKTYEEVLHEQILKPLGMENTGCDKKGLVLKNRAYSYQKLSDRYITWNEDLYAYEPGIVNFGCGNLYSTVEDLFKFSKALSTNQLLSKEYTDIFLKMRNLGSRHTLPNISKKLVDEFFGTYGNGFVGEISFFEDPETNEKDTLYWHDGTDKLFKSNHFHYTGKEQIIIICSNRSFLCEGDEIVLKIYQILHDKPYGHIRIKRSLSQYVSEDIAMHAGVPEAINEYLRFKDDTAHFIAPGQDYLIYHGRAFAEMGDLDNAILIFQTAIAVFPDSWQAYDGLGEIYTGIGDKAEAIRCFKKSLELNPGNENAGQMLKSLEML